MASPTLLSSVSKAPSPSSTRSSTPFEISLPPNPAQHSRYYIQDDMSVFLVEDHLFRVHRYFLDRESQFFPKGTGSIEEPILLPGVTQTEFESLLDFFYDGMHNETTPPLSAWTSILSISTRFGMSRVRSRAIKEIFDFWPRIDPVDQVVLAVKHNVPDWLPLAYAVLCQRNDPIEVDEAKKLGLETVVFFAKAREKVRRASIASRPTSPDPTPFSASLVSRVIDEIFWPAPKLPDPKCEETMLSPESALPEDYDKEPAGGSWNQTTIRIFDVVKDDLKIPQAEDKSDAARDDFPYPKDHSGAARDDFPYPEPEIGGKKSVQCLESGWEGWEGECAVVDEEWGLPTKKKKGKKGKKEETHATSIKTC